MADARKLGFAPSRRRPGAFSWCSPTTACISEPKTRAILGSAADLVARAAKSERFTGKSGSALDIVAPAGLKADPARSSSAPARRRIASRRTW